ncbi:histidine kinase dimerization/phospho-acceptor domain-containing protein [Idiomarina sp. OT37-5b]|jgi:signal transduction histidine kinase|uniref:histidine kinase dimerization/phospho-acceptor domain-containing protein n=1 Tax=Idiomarina sp. OT37-5b TaxID=2100422 RepID=UPI0021CB3D14|nr:histidine kinase dimerization/phospho-acceptor domain-containing protein [Idiomarina sp. OT37-5b]
MQLIRRFQRKLHSIRRRILIAVSLVYLLSSAVSAVWIHQEISHEVDELFDAEMVQQAKTLLALVSIVEQLPAQQLTIDPLNAHSYEGKLSYRIEQHDGNVVMQTRGSMDLSRIDFREGFSIQQIGQEVWHTFGVSSADQRYRILLLQEDEFRAEIRTDLTTDTVIPVLTLLPLMLWLGWWTINRNFASFTRLANALRRKRSTDYQPFTEANDPEEVALVKRALNHYLHRIEQSFLRERRFSADAAHELRTPLASLKAQLQNLIRRADNDEQKQQLNGLLTSTERLVKLVESLLLLARTEMPPEPMQALNVASIARQVMADYYHKLEAKGLQYQVQLPQRLEWLSDEAYLSMLLTNLIDNAVKYAPPGSVIEMSVQQGELLISNEVDGVHQIDTERLTERFYRGQQLDVDGSGLGLSIVKQLAQQLQLTIRFERHQQRFIARLHFDTDQQTL